MIIKNTASTSSSTSGRNAGFDSSSFTDVFIFLFSVPRSPPAAVLQLVHGPAGRYRRARAGGGRGQRTVQSPSDALPGMGRRAGGTRPGCGVRASDGTGVMDRKASRSSGRRSARIHRSSMSTVPIRCRGEGWSSTRHAAGPSSDSVSYASSWPCSACHGRTRRVRAGWARTG